MTQSKDTMPDLLPCPFCGGVAIKVTSMEDGGYAVHCMYEADADYRNESCCALGDVSYGDYHIGSGENRGEFKTAQEAISAWNTRADTLANAIKERIK